MRLVDCLRLVLDRELEQVLLCDLVRFKDLCASPVLLLLQMP